MKGMEKNYYYALSQFVYEKRYARESIACFMLYVYISSIYASYCTVNQMWYWPLTRFFCNVYAMRQQIAKTRQKLQTFCALQ